MRYLLPALWLSLASPAWADGLVIAPVKLLDTSHEARDQQAEHLHRQDLLAQVLAEEMPGTLLTRDEVAEACPRETTDCLVTLLRDRGGDRGLFIVVQKASTLILQAFASEVDLKGGKLIAHKELNFRGDNDESWRRAGVFLARQLRD
ncbi:Protein of unknown function [Paracoccus aminovorans]|uniref:DUF2380 domain-containing protein n=1 Tax=Paracoccus aminovorans TaxID=34004 RepID=A0A1I3BXF3_9RHOB|nr:DUF2380 domain-containing protein [Paracoccus aminovorans]CQR86252.1 hypothetical protein JCM7685_1686 [Paracoccus aminovorans]SFH66995.1 Protein of unknown function [Paracoccus aminovorans]